MEKQLFDWEGWDDLDDQCYAFYGITLVTDVVDYRKGTKFDRAIVDFSSGVLQLFKDKSDDVIEYQMSLRVLAMPKNRK